MSNLFENSKFVYFLGIIFANVNNVNLKKKYIRIKYNYHIKNTFDNIGIIFTKIKNVYDGKYIYLYLNDYFDKIMNFFHYEKKNVEKLQFNEFKNYNLNCNFLLGYFDSFGFFTYDHINGINCIFNVSCNFFKIYLRKIVKIPFIVKNNNKIIFTHFNAIDLLHNLYNNVNFNNINHENYFKYKNLISKFNELINLKIIKYDENAIMPQLKRISDVGLDIHIIKLIKKDGLFEHYDTGLTVIPPIGYYLKLYPRSSIYKSGCILANSTGIIDPTYLGTIKLILIHIDKEKKINLPLKIGQLIPEKHNIIFTLEEIHANNINITSRNKGGFGSTNKEK